MSCPGRMLECGEYRGHLYGTSVDAVCTVLDEGKICVLDLEPQVGLQWDIFRMSPKSCMHCAYAVG